MRSKPAQGPVALTCCDILLSHDFPPSIGGAHHWLYEVYSRWPSPVEVVTSRYSTDPVAASTERRFDSAVHGSLRIHRLVATPANISMLDWRFLHAVGCQLGDVARIGRSGHIRLHCLRAFPEGLVGLLRRRLYPRTTTLITYAHGEELLIARTSRQLTIIARQVLAGSDLVIANSENTRRLLLELAPAAQVVCIHPGVDVASYRFDRKQIDAYRDQLGWPPETVVLCTVARMERRKNHAMVIRALAQLRAGGVHAAYVCAGAGPEAAGLHALVRELGVERYVRFPGAIGEVDKRLLMAAADIHMMPAVQFGEMIEGFGIVFLEAAAAGTPSIAGRDGGQGEAVKHGVTGLVVDGAKLSEVMDAIGTLSVDLALRQRMSLEGRKWASENDWRLVTDSTVRAISMRLMAPPR